VLTRKKQKTGSKAAQKLRRDAEILSQFPTIQLEFAHQRLFAAAV
jgi:hypothetical protein